MIFLVVALGDPLVVNTIKHAVARPRPCITLPDVVERLGLQAYRQHALGARGELVCHDDGDVSFLPAQRVVHAADGAGRFIFARL